MNAQVKAIQVTNSINVLKEALAKAREIISSNDSGVETGKKVAELFNSIHPSAVNSLANRWIYQEIVYTSDEKYEALKDNIEKIALRYFGLTQTDDLRLDVIKSFKTEVGFELDLTESTNIIGVEGAEKAIRAGFAIANVASITEFFFNDNDGYLESMLNNTDDIDSEMPNLIEVLTTQGVLVISSELMQIRKVENIEDSYAIAISEKINKLFALYNSDF